MPQNWTYTNTYKKFDDLTPHARAKYSHLEDELPPGGIYYNRQCEPQFPDEFKFGDPVKLPGGYTKRHKDEQMANELANYDETPEGYTWHHEGDGVMQLVRSDVHDAFRHTGGFSRAQIAVGAGVGAGAGSVMTLDILDTGDPLQKSFLNFLQGFASGSQTEYERTRNDFLISLQKEGAFAHGSFDLGPVVEAMDLFFESYKRDLMEMEEGGLEIRDSVKNCDKCGAVTGGQHGKAAAAK